jgi:CheY-specific phosphatase CheX
MFESPDPEILTAAAQQVLETMFFASILGDRQCPPEEPAVGARLSFHGSPSGTFGVRLSADAARSMAGNFLGVEDERELTEAQIGEVICEMTNMICGAVLSLVESDSTFEIRLPALMAAGEAADAGATVRSLDLDTGALTMFLSFDRA